MKTSLNEQVLTPEQIELLPTEADVQFYEEHGWYFSPKVLPDALIEKTLQGIERYYQGDRDYELPVNSGYMNWKPEDGFQVMRNNEFISLQCRELAEFIRYPMFGAIAARLTRSDRIRLLDDQIINKPPGSDASVSAIGWHADRAYWGTCTSHKLLTAWTPLHDCDQQRGPIVLIDGSHRWPQLEHTRFFNNPDLDGIEASFLNQGHAIRKIPACLERGQISFHHCWTIHGSYPNQSPFHRLAFAAHFQDEDNHYQPCWSPEGKPVQMFDELLCRKQPNGDPDFTDPEIFPQLWPHADPLPAFLQ